MTRAWIGILALLGGCRHDGAAGPGSPIEAPAAPPIERFPFPTITDAACDADGCTVLTDGALRRHTGEPLGPLPPGACTSRLAGTPTSPGPCPDAPAWTALDPPLPVADQLARFRADWNAAIAAHGRLPFVPVIATPDGGALALARGGDGRGQLFRTGGMPRMVPVPTAPSPATWPAPFALHPSGTEAYLLSWPTPVLRAFDPFTLATRWTVSLDGAGQGLFVDPGGRFLLAAAGPGADDRWTDPPLLQPAPGAPWCDDALLWAEARPASDHVVVVDLAAHAVAARAPGRYRRWFLFDHVAWLVTDRELTRIPVGPPPG